MFLKNGAAPSYLYSGGGVREIESPSVPLGILDEVELKPRRVILEDDALIVMVTDGIFEAAPGRPQWLKMYLAEQTYTHPRYWRMLFWRRHTSSAEETGCAMI